MATNGQCVIEYLNWTLSIHAARMKDSKLSLDSQNTKLQYKTLLRDTSARIVKQAGKVMSNASTLATIPAIEATPAGRNLTGDALEWYTKSYFKVDLLTGVVARTCTAALLLVLLGAFIWTTHRASEELASDLQLGRVKRPYLAYLKDQEAMRRTAVISRAGFLMIVYSVFVLMDEADREQAMEWQWWASVTIGAGTLMWWAVLFLGYWVLGVVRKMKMKKRRDCRELVPFEEPVVSNRGSPGAWIA